MDLTGPAGQWRRSLQAGNKSPATVTAYLHSLAKLIAWAGPAGVDPYGLTPATLEQFLADQLVATRRTGGRHGVDTGQKITPESVAKHYRHLKVFYGWLADRDDVPNPFGKVRAPIVPEKFAPHFTDDQLRALLHACRGKGFGPRRDTALIRMLFDAGVRRSELAGMTLDGLDLDAQVARVLGKGRKQRLIPYGARTAEALDDYLRARARHPDRAMPALWLAQPPNRGPLGYDGVAQLVERRALDAGVPDANMHRFRHTAAHRQLAAGLSEGDAMRVFGWTTRAMLDRYGRQAAHERALAAAKRISHADDL
jgi:site-specific recombinase XerD